VPKLATGYRAPFPKNRPLGLRTYSLRTGTVIWRVEATEPADWTWDGFPEPRYRFDPASGEFRTRYAARTYAGAFRERYRDTGRVIPADHATQYLIRLVCTRPLKVFDLRTQKNQDILELDDQINTGQQRRVWQKCHQLADAVRMWWSDLDAIVYRSRTTPETSVNYAFFAHDGFTTESWPLADRTDILVDMVLNHDFTVNWHL
jgi:RES domain